MTTTVGQIIVNEALPAKYRDYTRLMDKDTTDAVLEAVATDNPELYREVSKNILQAGAIASYEEGTTLRLRDLASTSANRKKIFDYVSKQEEEIDKDKRLSRRERQDIKEDLYDKALATITDETYNQGLTNENPFALQVKSKARGSKGQLTALLSTPGTYANHKGETVPVFIRRSYAEGLRPEEYWAAAHGGRVGVLGTKTGTAKAGYLGKLFSMAAVETVVTEEDCGTHTGLPVDTNDPDNIGAVLARKYGPFSAGTVVTKQVIDGLKKAKVAEIAVRSPTTCSTTSGVCQLCTGKRETGRFPELGSAVGSVAATAIREPLAQQSLNTKHSGKAARGEGRVFSGFEVLKNLATAPKSYPDRASVATVDGRITNIKPAPQGGTDIWVDEVQHHALTGMDPTVKIGDIVEAGDVMSDGVANPSEIVKYKGIGEGRRYWTNRYTKAMKQTGLPVHRRNLEVIARSLVNHVTIDDEDAAGDYLPGDTVEFSAWNRSYKPREGHTEEDINKTVGKYLETPILHYSVGTRITPSVTKRLKQHGYDKITVHDKPPGVTPVFKSIVETPSYYEDWMGRLGSSYLEKRLLSDAHKGSVSDIHGINPLPGIAKAVEFGNPPPKTNTPW